MITIEYAEKLIEIPINVWNDFEEQQGEQGNGDTLDFLGEDTDIVLDDAGFERLKEIAQSSQIAAKIISELSAVTAGAAYDPSQPRDENGQWTDQGGVSIPVGAPGTSTGTGTGTGITSPGTGTKAPKAPAIPHSHSKDRIKQSGILSPDQKQHVMDTITSPDKVGYEWQDRFMNRLDELPNPVSNEVMVERTKIVKESNYELLKDTKVILMPAGSVDAHGWTTPLAVTKNMIFIPKVSADYNVEKEYQFKSMAFIAENDKPELREDQTFQDWKTAAQTLTPLNAQEKTMLHEQGHQETYKALDKLDGENPKESRFYTRNPVMITGALDDYSHHPSVFEKLTSDDPAERAFLLGEMVAEDWRLMNAPDKPQALFPNRYMGMYDLKNPEAKQQRFNILKRAFKW